MQPHHTAASEGVPLTTVGQRIFVRYYVGITIDLMVLSALSQFWHQVSIANFSTALIAAILLQLLLQGTLIVEHMLAKPFVGKHGWSWRIGRFFTAWFVLFLSKFVMLWAVNWVLGDAIQFSGAMHGALAFIAAVLSMVALETTMFSLFKRLGSAEQRDER